MTKTATKMATLRDKSLIGHTILAVVAALTAWLAWAEPALTNSGNETVVMVPGSPEELAAIRWQDDRYEVKLAREGVESFTVSVQSLQNKEGEEEPGPAKSYPGSERAQKLFEELAPLEAARTLGVVEEGELAAYGLASPSGTLGLSFGSDEEVTIPIGAATYGSGDRYAKGPNDQIYLLKSSLLGGLRHGASAMLDRNALGIAAEDIQRIVISAGMQSRELRQRYGEDRDRAYFADPAVPDVKLEKITAWVDRILKLRVVDVKQPQPRETPRVVVDLYNGKKKLGRIELWGTTDTTATARSSRFDGPVTVNKAAVEAILNDLEVVLQEGR